MDIRRLRYFVRVAEDSSLTRAAGMLRIAQSALSRQIRLLEEDLGVALFDRTARGMRLTGEGEHLRASVAGPLREMELALQSVRSHASTHKANLAVGIPPSLAEFVATRLATDLHVTFPTIRFSLIEGPTGSLVDWLQRGMIDFALLEEPSGNDTLNERKLRSLQFALAGPCGIGEEVARVIPIEEAMARPLVVPAHHLGIRAVLNGTADRLRIKLDIRFEADSARLIRNLVGRGVGYCLLPEAYLRRDVADGRLAAWALGGQAPSLDIVLSSRRASGVLGRQFLAVEECIIGSVGVTIT